jgi:hypothetical protein
VAAGEQRREHLVDHVALANDDAADLRLDAGDGFHQLLRGLLGILDQCLGGILAVAHFELSRADVEPRAVLETQLGHRTFFGPDRSGISVVGDRVALGVVQLHDGVVRKHALVGEDNIAGGIGTDRDRLVVDRPLFLGLVKATD